MKETLRSLSNHGRIYILLYLCAIAWINILPFTCFGIKIAYAEPVFSVKSTNEPLYQVLAKIFKATGYQIAITKGWENKPITADIKNTTLEEGMKKIIRLMGEPSNAIIRNDRAKKIEIIILDASAGYSSVGINRPAEHRQRQKVHTGIDSVANPDLIDDEVIPPPPPEEPEREIIIPD